MKTQRLVVLVLLCLMSATRSEAQRLPAELPRFQPRLSARWQSDTAPKASPHSAGDYTWEGAAIGGLALGLFGAYFGSGMCGMDDTAGNGCALAALTGFLGGASVGATLGGIIGSAQKKDSTLAPAAEVQPPPVPLRADSTLFPKSRRHGGDGAALGATMVGGTVAFFTALGCGLDRSGGHENCALKALTHGAVGAVAGGVLGAWVGASVR